ncbi:EAL domain-containing protein [Streptomyces sp. NPDC047002]|uniref:putative bifunctional diguanylate cyclase/phosphodiesterase n=1 Tax=Streptomyces sp. NPDC047002 TaxID=3155475 RepID=UPI00345249AE
MSAEGALVGRRRAGGSGGLLAQLALALVCAGYAAGAATGWGSQEVSVFMGDFGLSLAALIAAVSCFVYARGKGRSFRSAWLLFSLSSFMAAGGNAIWGWYEVVLREPVPAPSLADLFFLCFAPPAIVGLLVLAKRPATKAGWVCLGLDAWLIGGSLLTLSWSLALAHTARVDGPSVPQAALALAYPLLDIVLVSMVLALHFRHTASRTAVNTAISALALTVLCDGLFTSPLLRAEYRSGQLLDAGWFAGSLLLAYAPWGVRHLPEVRQRPAARRRSGVAGVLAALTPYLSAAVCTLGILYTAVEGHQVDRVVILTGCTVVLALVVRQGIMLVDHVALTQELAQKENHFRSLVQGSSDVIMIAAPSGVLRYVSPAASGVYGRGAEELEGVELASLIHPADLGKVVHEVRRFLASPPAREPSARVEYRFRSGTGGWLNVESTVNRHEDGLIFNSRDVTERVRLQAQLQHNAEHDPLTDLPNRALFTRRVGQALAGRRAGDAGTAVLFIDLDGFKGVNDRLGHQVGDELLIHAARRLQASVRAGDTAARLGGDEFAALVLTGEGGGADGASRADRERTVGEIADRLRLTLSEPYRIEGHDVRVAASIGIAFAEPGADPADLMRNADLAMYRAKAAGKNRVELYAPQLRSDAVRSAELTGRVRTALHEGQFALLHQPVVDLATGRICGVTAQPRWRAPQGLLFTPAEFLRIADDHDHGRAAEFGHRLLDDAVRRAAERLRATGHEAPVVVRLPARRLLDRPPRLDSVEALLTRHGLPSGSLTIELADADHGVDPEELERRLRALRRLGVRIALDGFGSGFSAIHALRSLPLDALKLDRGLVEGIAESPRLHRITAGLLRIAGDLGMQSVADGVDRPDQILALRALGCTHGQGAAFSGPLDEHRLRRALGRGAYPLPSSEEADGAVLVPGGAGRPVARAAGSGPHGAGGAQGGQGLPASAGEPVQGRRSAGGPPAVLGPAGAVALPSGVGGAPAGPGPSGVPGAVGVCGPSAPEGAVRGLFGASLSALGAGPLRGDRPGFPSARSNGETSVPPT